MEFEDCVQRVITQQHVLALTAHVTTQPHTPLQEDIEELPAPRMFWPREIWGQFATELEDFKAPSNRAAAVQCLNCLVGNALEHIPHCMK